MRGAGFQLSPFTVFAKLEVGIIQIKVNDSSTTLIKSGHIRLPRQDCKTYLHLCRVF